MNLIHTFISVMLPTIVINLGILLLFHILTPQKIPLKFLEKYFRLKIVAGEICLRDIIATFLLIYCLFSIVVWGIFWGLLIFVEAITS